MMFFVRKPDGEYYLADPKTLEYELDFECYTLELERIEENKLYFLQKNT